MCRYISAQIEKQPARWCILPYLWMKTRLLVHTSPICLCRFALEARTPGHVASVICVEAIGECGDRWIRRRLSQTEHTKVIRNRATGSAFRYGNCATLYTWLHRKSRCRTCSPRFEDCLVDVDRHPTFQPSGRARVLRAVLTVRMHRCFDASDNLPEVVSKPDWHPAHWRTPCIWPYHCRNETLASVCNVWMSMHYCASDSTGSW